MAETHLDPNVVAEGIHWFSGYGPVPIVGPCPHDCDHKWGCSVIAWGYDRQHYELITCDRPDTCAGRCRGWQADHDGTGWSHGWQQTTTERPTT